jgi:hypothetical protein
MVCCFASYRLRMAERHAAADQHNSGRKRKQRSSHLILHALVPRNAQRHSRLKSTRQAIRFQMNAP